MFTKEVEMLKGQKVYVLTVMTDIEGIQEAAEHDCSDSVCGVFGSFDLALEELIAIAAKFNTSLVEDDCEDLSDTWVLPDMMERGVKYHEGLQTYWIDEYVIDQPVRLMEESLEIGDQGHA